MFGYVKKDLLMIKRNLKSMLIVLIIFGLMAMEQNNEFSFFPIFVSIMLSISTFSYDEYNQWNSYAMTLPNGRKNMIKAKYLTAFLLAVIASIISIIFFISTGILHQHLKLVEIIPELLVCFSSIGLVIAVMYPIIFKYGVEKGRLGIFVTIILLVAITNLLIQKINISIPKNLFLFFNHYYLVIVPIVMFIVLFFSYRITLFICMKKEY